MLEDGHMLQSIMAMTQNGRDVASLEIGRLSLPACRSTEESLDVIESMSADLAADLRTIGFALHPLPVVPELGSKGSARRGREPPEVDSTDDPDRPTNKTCSLRMRLTEDRRAQVLSEYRKKLLSHKEVDTRVRTSE